VKKPLKATHIRDRGHPQGTTHHRGIARFTSNFWGADCRAHVFRRRHDFAATPDTMAQPTTLIVPIAEPSAPETRIATSATGLAGPNFVATALGTTKFGRFPWPRR